MSDTWNTLREQIEYFSQPFPEAAIAFADAHREEVAAHVVESITRLADRPGEDVNPDYVLHLYAMHILATWRETLAYAPLVRIGHNSEEMVDRLLGGTVTESYRRCLASVCNGDMALLQGFAADIGAVEMLERIRGWWAGFAEAKPAKPSRRRQSFRCDKSPRSVATTLALAAAARNTRSTTVPKMPC